MPASVKQVRRRRETGSVEVKSMQGRPLAKLLPDKHQPMRLVAKELDLTLKQIGERVISQIPHGHGNAHPNRHPPKRSAERTFESGGGRGGFPESHGLNAMTKDPG